MPPADPFDLQRFVTAQSENYADALAELKRGRKATHWMWYVFPQLAELGSSSNAIFYGIRSRDEAIAAVRKTLDSPIRFRIRSKALRVRIASHHPGVSPSAALPDRLIDLPGQLWDLATDRA